MKRAGRILFLSFVFFLLHPLTARGLDVKNVAEMVVCQCGCGLVLASCNHQECGSKEELLGKIRDYTEQGLHPEEVVAALVKEYGEKILAAPTKKGFNLVAWVTPFFALMAGTAFILTLIFLRLRGRKNGVEQDKPPVPVRPDYLRRVERDLEELDF